VCDEETVQQAKRAVKHAVPEKRDDGLYGIKAAKLKARNQVK